VTVAVLLLPKLASARLLSPVMVAVLPEPYPATARPLLPVTVSGPKRGIDLGDKDIQLCGEVLLLTA
jgi:hypothetical protein